MTDNEIINALECFKSEDCLGEQCPYFEMSGLCGKPMCSDVYDFIYRQKAEIERLKCSAIRNGKQIGSLIHHLETAKSEAYREFAERLCKDRVSNDPVVIAVKVELEELTRNLHGTCTESNE